MVDAWRHLARFERTRRFYPWLYTLLRNRCFKALAARKGPSSLDGLALVDPSQDAAEDVHALAQALGRLEPELRELILLKHLDGLSYDELAERLGVPAGTVMSRLHHARMMLKTLLDAAP